MLNADNEYVAAMGELDHHNAEEIRKESDHLIEHNHIRYVIFDFAILDGFLSSAVI